MTLPPRPTPTAAPLTPGVVGVVGVGLIGGSVARACITAGVPVVATDVRPEVREAAAEAGIEVADGLDDVVARADVLVLAVSPRVTVDVWGQVAERRAVADDRLVVIDVASTKTPLREALAEGRVPWDTAGACLLPTHPMAGRARGGFDASLRDLFDGAAWILCPHAQVRTGELARALGLVAAVGARACFLDLQVHDRFAAMVSHVPHLLAFCYRELLDAVDPNGAWAVFSGGSLADLLRVADADRDLWNEILAANEREIGQVRDELVAALERGPAAQGPAPVVADAADVDCVQLPWSATLGEATVVTLASTGQRALEVVAVDTDADGLTLSFARQRMP